MKVGIDIHGVITENPKFFSKFSHMIVKSGGEVHVLTGPRFNRVEPILRKHNIKYTHFFSIVEYEEKRGKVQIIWDKKGDPFMEMNVWDRTKAIYAKKHKLDLHIDDSAKYGEYFKTPFALYKNNSKTK